MSYAEHADVVVMVKVARAVEWLELLKTLIKMMHMVRVVGSPDFVKTRMSGSWR